MTNKQKRRGDEFERSQRDFYRAAGFPFAERTKAGYERDGGDVHLDPDPSRPPGVIAQAKNVVTPRWSEWITGLREQIRNARADVGFIAWKRKGVGWPGDQLAVMPMTEFLELLRRAGYGMPLNWRAQCEDCGGLIAWIDAPTGGWWAHDVHPDDDHDAVTSVEIVDDIDAQGVWFAARNQKGTAAA